jgi:hypothetical protein
MIVDQYLHPVCCHNNEVHVRLNFTALDVLSFRLPQCPSAIPVIDCDYLQRLVRSIWISSQFLSGFLQWLGMVSIYVPFSQTILLHLEYTHLANAYVHLCRILPVIAYHHHPVLGDGGSSCDGIGML